MWRHITTCCFSGEIFELLMSFFHVLIRGLEWGVSDLVIQVCHHIMLLTHCNPHKTTRSEHVLIRSPWLKNLFVLTATPENTLVSRDADWQHLLNNPVFLCSSSINGFAHWDQLRMLVCKCYFGVLWWFFL